MGQNSVSSNAHRATSVQAAVDFFTRHWGSRIGPTDLLSAAKSDARVRLGSGARPAAIRAIRAMAGPAARRPSASGAATLALLVGLVALGCSSTPIDAVVTSDSFEVTAEPDSSSDDTPGGAGSLPDTSLPDTSMSGAAIVDCQSVTTPIDPGVYQLKVPDADECLAVGVPVNLTVSVEAISTTLAPCSSNSDQLWRFIVSGLVYFEVRSVQVAWNLDTALGGSSTGTRLVLYSPHGADNQQFFPRSRLGGNFEFSPSHALSQCLTRNDRVELGRCSSSNALQEWELIPRACL